MGACAPYTRGNLKAFHCSDDSVRDVHVCKMKFTSLYLQFGKPCYCGSFSFADKVAND